ncbi:hypothetical protein A1OO_09520 [Enterovibrio norvegicus FF-33]|nr:hypothetical protein A1OO_09520 [Enterovibrio norvegicus FF-33]
MLLAGTGMTLRFPSFRCLFNKMSMTSQRRAACELASAQIGGFVVCIGIEFFMALPSNRSTRKYQRVKSFFMNSGTLIL